jgi:hypothetical protein
MATTLVFSANIWKTTPQNENERSSVGSGRVKEEPCRCPTDVMDYPSNITSEYL